MIGVICAMAIEAQSFIERLTDCREEKILNISFWEGKLEEKSVVVTVSGVGKVSAGIATALMIEHYRPSLIINSGIAGGFDLNTRLLDVVLGEQIAYYDFDISFDGAFLFGQVPDAPLWFSGDEKALAIASKVQLPNPIHRGRIITADCFQTDRKAVEKALAKLQVETVQAIDMESAAIAQVAYRFQTPCLIIRSISDILGQEDQAEHYYNWITQACENALKISLFVIANYH